MTTIAHAQEEAAAPAEGAAADPATPLSWTEGWKGSIEVGLNGSDGNTERFNLRAGAEAKRVTPDYETLAKLIYSYGRDGSTESQNEARFDLRNDWILDNPRWRLFAQGSFEYDEFQDWDTRLSLFGGVGYSLIQEEKTRLIGRLGAGVTRPIGGSDNTWTPEGLIGADFEHAFTDRQKVTASANFYPALDDFGPYRFDLSAAYEILVDPETSMSLKLGVIDRYDSTPGAGFKRNDLEYFALLVWAF